MTTYGYARVSTTDQDLSIQVEALRKAGCEVIREEKRSGDHPRGKTGVGHAPSIHPLRGHPHDHPH